MLASPPPCSAPTSRSIFSVSSSPRGSPTSTRSPSFLSQRATRASTRDSPSCGTTIFDTRSSGGSDPVLTLHLLRQDQGSLHRLGPHLEGLLDERLLIELMPRGRTLRRARRARTADVTQRPASPDHFLESRMHELPGPHVLRLFLQPDDLAQLRVAIERLPQRDGREW